jgi:hypothetical protein
VTCHRFGPVVFESDSEPKVKTGESADRSAHSKERPLLTNRLKASTPWSAVTCHRFGLVCFESDSEILRLRPVKARTDRRTPRRGLYSPIVLKELQREILNLLHLPLPCLAAHSLDSQSPGAFNLIARLFPRTEPNFAINKRLASRLFTASTPLESTWSPERRCTRPLFSKQPKS